MYSFGYNAKVLSSRVCVRDGSGALPIFYREAGAYSPTRLFLAGHAQLNQDVVCLVF